MWAAVWALLRPPRGSPRASSPTESGFLNKKDFTIDASTNETITFEFSPDEPVPSRQIIECGVHETCFDPRTKRTSNLYTLARLAPGRYGKGPWA